MEINVKKVWLLNKFAEEMHYSKLDTLRKHSKATFLKKLFHYSRKEG